MGNKQPILKEINLCDVAQQMKLPHITWIYDDKYVYDVTSFVKNHPGGSLCLIRKSNILISSQRDINYHSRKAKNIMKQYIIGTISQCKNSDCVYCINK